jgi:hypothetical protein
VAGAWRFCNAQFKAPAREETMKAAMMAFGIATLICYLLMTQLQNRRAISGSPRAMVSDGSVALKSAMAEAISSGAEMIAPQPVIRALQTR